MFSANTFTSTFVGYSFAFPGVAAYAASKSGLIGLTQALAALGQFERLFHEHQAQDRASLWDVHVDDLIPSRNFRRVHYGEA